jgi:hypothetical protein
MTVSQRVRAAALAICVGAIFILFNFNGLIRHFATRGLSPESTLSRLVVSVSRWPGQAVGVSTDALYEWMIICFLGLWAYLAIILLLAVVRRRASLAGWAFLGLLSGTFSPALLSWTALLIWAILRVLHTIAAFIGHIVLVVAHFLGSILVYVLPVVLAIALIAAIVAAWKSFGGKFVMLGAAAAAALYFLAPMVVALFENFIRPFLRWLGGILAFLFGWLPAVFRWLGGVLAFLFGWLPTVLKWLAVLLGVLLGVSSFLAVLGCAGQILIDQFKTAAEVGRSQKGILIGSFSLGASLALILLVSAGSPEALVAHVAVPAMAPASIHSYEQPFQRVAQKRKKRRGRRTMTKPALPRAVPLTVPQVPPLSIASAIDRAWTHSTPILATASPTAFFLATLPSGVRDGSARAFRTASIPIFDAAILASILGLSMIGLLRGMLARSDVELTMRFYNNDLVIVALLPVAVLFLVLAASEGNQD